MLNEAVVKILKEIQADQRDHFELYDDAAIWNRKYSFDSYRIAQGVLTRLGFDGVRDNQRISHEQILESFQAHKAALITDHVVAVIGHRGVTPKLDNIAAHMKHMNAILRAVYGIRVISDKRAMVNGKKVSTDYHIDSVNMDSDSTLKTGYFTRSSWQPNQLMKTKKKSRRRL